MNPSLRGRPRAPGVSLALVLLTACNPWASLPSNGYSSLDEPTWDPLVAAAADGIYVRLPHAGELVRVKADGSWERVDLLGADPERLVVSPDGETLLVFGSWPVCDTSERRIRTVEDCLEEDPELLTEERELALVRDGVRVTASPVEPQLNELVFTADGQRAVAYVDFDQAGSLEDGGLVNLAEVLFMDLASGTVTVVPVGFAPDRILFTEDHERAVVLSRSEVAVFELTSGNYDRLVSFPLSLDVDEDVRPQEAVLTPEGRYVLLTVAGRQDLYVLDLEGESINIVGLDAVPSALSVDSVSDRTVVAYGGAASLDLVDHRYFGVERFELEEPANAIQAHPGMAVAYNVSAVDAHDAIFLDLTTDAIREYRLENPATSLALNEEGTRAVAFTRPEVSGATGAGGWLDSYHGVTVLDLTSTAADAIHLAASGAPLGLAMTGDTALVLLEGVSELIRLDLLTGEDTALEMPYPPLSIGTFGERLYVTQDVSLGFISLVDTDGTNRVDVSGFAALGLLQEETLLPRQPEE